MTKLLSETRNLNIRCDLPAEIWDRVPDVYALMEGWLGFGDGIKGMDGIPYWFGFNEEEAHISASVEPGGLQFFVTDMDEEKWNFWLSHLKLQATKILGFRVGEIELGEVNSEIEWIVA
ncbi:hypothetical protein UNDKW_3856 [Undibacterium sp. KW1]|uniref:hypothetical protein n=1 Tax=Undibacterium sp. KW1 TaxID=2058624 RepID=UPI001331D208|nr:hypothetical protein [Undibacterium sp. KW1]BBB62129.1 hypothetical protein UNDKW_3856 [Undibacterium sp. KW1]